MRDFIIAILIINVILLISNTGDSKESHSSRKKRSDVTSSAISDKKSKKTDIKFCDEPTQKKQLSENDNDMNIDVSIVEEPNRKLKQLRYHKTHEGDVFMTGEKEEIKNSYKHKSRKSGKKREKRTKRCGQQNFVHNINNIHSDNDRCISLSISKHSLPSVNYKKQNKNKNNNFMNILDENSIGDKNFHKHQKYRQASYKMIELQLEDKKRYKSKHETPIDIDEEFNVEPNEKNKPNTQQSEDNLNSRKFGSTKANRDEKLKNNGSKVQKIIPKERIYQLSTGIDPSIEEKVNQNLYQSAPRICIRGAADDDQNSFDKSCEV